MKPLDHGEWIPTGIPIHTVINCDITIRTNIPCIAYAANDEWRAPPAGIPIHTAVADDDASNTAHEVRNAVMVDVRRVNLYKIKP